MNDKEREIWVGENRFYLGKDNVVHITIIGEQDEKIACDFKEILFEFSNMAGERVKILVDLNKAGKASAEARMIWKELTEKEDFGKTALFGMNPVARVLASFVIGVSKKKDLRFFKTKEEALAWLTGEVS